MGIRIELYDHDDDDLWCKVGRLVTDRAVHRDLGGPIYSAEGVSWFVAVDSDGEVIGFASMRPADDTLHYDYAYVAPGKRGKGVFTRLAKMRDKWAAKSGARQIRTVVRQERWKHYRKRGWAVKSRRGSWVHARKEVG